MAKSTKKPTTIDKVTLTLSREDMEYHRLGVYDFCEYMKSLRDLYAPGTEERTDFTEMLRRNLIIYTMIEMNLGIVPGSVPSPN